MGLRDLASLRGRAARGVSSRNENRLIKSWQPRHIGGLERAFIGETFQPASEDAMVYLTQFTPTQALAHQRLSRAISTALHVGDRVPCVEDPTAWDELTSAWYCLRCPVLDSCSTYADTGAVEHGILAGRRMSPKRRTNRARGRAA